MSAQLQETCRAASLDSLGCDLGGLLRNERLQAGRSVVMRKTSRRPLGRVTTNESIRGALLGVSLSGHHRRSIVIDGREKSFTFHPGQIYLRDFAEPYRAELQTAFDFLLVEIPYDDPADEWLEARSLSLLPRLQADTDPVLPHLAAALLPSLSEASLVSTLFVDQMVLAMQAHLISRFGPVPSSPRRRPLLSRAQEARAKELLAGHLDGDVLVGDIAAACGMSRSSFMKGFRATTGTTPMQWLTQRRIEAAKRLLEGSELSLAEIGARCGFADQSHFTRVFSARTGAPPGAWRRGA
ncbi:helix-turn-helix domain-containing protein [Bosea sp. (in: a-proteobacteria)]|uniref:AraC family transcriptional regulator n=1 Tax=Bosea sp. (in: a-proteobacteria) TaxID=1871050 RepID=UPI003B39FE3E